MKRYFFLLVFTFVLTNCAPKTISQPSLTNLADTTDECRYMDNVCKEAKEFQREYNSFSEEAKEELLPVLNSYIENCGRAAELCNESMK